MNLFSTHLYLYWVTLCPITTSNKLIFLNHKNLFSPILYSSVSNLEKIRRESAIPGLILTLEMVVMVSPAHSLHIHDVENNQDWSRLGCYRFIKIRLVFSSSHSQSVSEDQTQDD